MAAAAALESSAAKLYVYDACNELPAVFVPCQSCVLCAWMHRVYRTAFGCQKRCRCNAVGAACALPNNGFRIKTHSLHMLCFVKAVVCSQTHPMQRVECLVPSVQAKWP